MAQKLEGAEIKFIITDSLEIKTETAYAMGCCACEWYAIDDERWEVNEKFTSHIDEQHPQYPYQYEKRDYSGVK